MSNSIIPVPAPIGTNLQSFQNTIGPNVVQAEAVTLVDSTGAEKATTGNPLKVDGSGVTQPVSGTVGVSNFPATQAVTLPAGQGVELIDSGGTNKASISAGGAVKVDGSAVTQPISAASQPFPSGAGSLLSGQGTATSTAAALPNNPCKKVTLKVNISAAANVYVGPSGVTASTGLELGPDESIPIEVSNTNLIFVITASTSAAYSWLAVN